jgi:hypothetical protein
MNRGLTVTTLILLVIVFALIGGLHKHFADHAESTLEAQQAAHDRVAHEQRLAWQQSHAKEYAAKRAQERSGEVQRQRDQAKQRETNEKAQQQRVDIQQDALRAEQGEIASQIHPSDLVKSYVVTGSKLGLVIDRDLWDSLSHQDRKLFFDRVEPIWDAIYARHNPGSSETSDIMLFDLNHDRVTDYGQFTVYGN